jgi:DNA polymerase-4
VVDESLLNEYPEARHLRFLFLDLNSYFASVEQQEHPELRNKPVAVVPVEADSSFVIAASYEAKAFGVKTGTKIGDAKRMCPDLISVKGGHHLYTHYHRKIIQVAESVLPVERVCSIDEMVFRLLGQERSPVRAREIALEMKQALREGVGECIRCSIGIAPNQFLAKVATDMQKPDGLVILQSDDLPHALFRLDLTDLAGINKRMAARLNSAGIFTVQQLCTVDRTTLRSAWGSIVGERWWYKLRGVELNDHETDRKSLGHSHVMAPELRTDQGSKEVLLRLLQKASARLRATNLAAKAMAVGVSGRKPWKAHCRFPATHDVVTLNEHFLALWKDRNFEGPVKVSVTFTELEELKDVTPSLFEPAQERAKLSEAIDELNQKFGKNTVFLAGMWRAKDAAPERIAFNKTELFVEGKGDHEWVDTFRGLTSKEPS